MCPSAEQIKAWRFPGRTQILEVIQNPAGPRLAVPTHIVHLDRPVLDHSRGEWWDIAGKAPGFSASGRLDPDLRKGIVDELSGRGGYQVVDAPEQADFIFLAEGFYADRLAGFTGAQSTRFKPTGRPMLAAVMAIVVPANIYKRCPGDSGLLLQAKLWEGSEAWKSNPPMAGGEPAATSASLENLVAQFLDPREHNSSFPPLCSARDLAPSVDGAGKPRTQPTLQNVEAGRPRLPAGPSDDFPNGKAFRVDVSLVTVPTMVSDADGRRIGGLTASSFHVFEDGIEQKIDRVIPEDTPFSVALMLDTSGSTVFKHAEIQDAALAFMSALREGDQLMVLSFDSYIYLDSAFTTDRSALRRAILRTDTGAGTRLYDALDLVLTECLIRVQGRKAIVLFTDGIDTQSLLSPLGNYQARTEESDAIVYAIQFDTTVPTTASRYLSGLTEKSGGRLFMASSVPHLSDAFAGIADELRHQYTICYYPSSQGADSQFRKLRVTVDRPDATVRARTGYRSVAR